MMMLLNGDAAREYINNSKYFKSKEFECPCGCDEFRIDTKLIDFLDELRDNIDSAIYVNSGFRCQEHNDSLPNSSKHSQHVLGKAADIRTKPFMKDKIIELAEKIGFNGIGINYDSFIHVDTRVGGKVKF